MPNHNSSNDGPDHDSEEDGSRVLLVTGASRGIGAAIALRAAADGWDVAVNYRRDRAAAERVADQVRATGRRALSVPADISDEAAVRSMFDTVDAELGTLTGLVNNAGIVAPAARLDDATEMTVQRWRRMFEVNVIAAMLCSQLAVQRMSTRTGGRGGVVVNVSSGAARNGSPGVYVDYAAAKAAVDTFTLGLAKEVAAEGIRVNAVRPGLVDTEIHADSGDPRRAHTLTGSVPLGRVGTPAEIAEGVIWLLSDASGYVTGSILDITGGR